jgi:hypothetical protein
MAWHGGPPASRTLNSFWIIRSEDGQITFSNSGSRQRETILIADKFLPSLKKRVLWFGTSELAHMLTYISTRHVWKDVIGCSIECRFSGPSVEFRIQLMINLYPSSFNSCDYFYCSVTSTYSKGDSFSFRFPHLNPECVPFLLYVPHSPPISCSLTWLSE